MKVAEQVYTGDCAMAPSILPHRQQDEFMQELHQELTKCMARTGLQGKSRLARPTARAGDVPTAILPHRPIPPVPGLWGGVGQATKRRHLSGMIRVKKPMFPF